jgi:hypothetical protein
MKLRNGVAAAAMFAGTLLVGPLASAGIMVTTGVSNTGTDNVLSNACGAHITGPAFMVQGCLNTSHSTLVDFTSNENITYTGGQAKIVAVDGDLNFLKIALDDTDFTFNKLLLNIEAVASPTGGFVTFTGNPGGTSSSFKLDPNGQNKFVITGADFKDVSFTTTIGVASVDLVTDVKQVRIGGIESTNPDNPPPPPPPDIPEPGMLSLLGLALVSLGSMRRRRLA